MPSSDLAIGELLSAGRLRVDFGTGYVFAPMSNTPSKPLGARTAKGYLRTCISYQGNQVYVMLHRVVWIAAYGAPLNVGLEIDHLNSDKIDNRPSNLQLVESGINMRRATEAGAFRNNGAFNRLGAARDAKGQFARRT